MAYYLTHFARLLLILAYLGYIFAILETNTAPVGAQGPFKGKSFSLSSRVTIISSKDATTVTSSVQESYSIVQRRARISYATPNRLFVKSGVFYLDFKNLDAEGIVLHYDNYYGDCKKSYLSAVHDQFATRNPIPLFVEDQSLSSAFGEDFIAGPARLLFVVENNRNIMKLMSAQKIMVRNLACLMYIIDGAPELGSNTQLTIFYSIESIASKDQVIPVQIVLSILDNTPNRGAIRVTVIDYSRFDVISDNRPKSASRAHWVTDEQVVFDEFAFRPASGCSNALQSSHEIDLFGSRSRETTKFSFKAKTEHLLGAKKLGQKSIVMKNFVAYDARLATLRYEIYSVIVNEQKGPSSALKYMIFNFKANRIYHAMQRVPKSNTTVDRILDLSSEHEHAGKTATTQCVAAVLGQSYDNGITIGRILAGADKFVYMGRAQVRGVDAKVYETTFGSLPYWLGQPTVFMTPDKEWQTRKPDIGPGPDDRNAMATTVLLYLDEKDASQTLLMVEIYQLSKATFQVFAKQRIEVTDFAWELTESPRGDRVTELFSLANFCSEDASIYARVEMVLEGQPQQIAYQTKRQSDRDSLLYVNDARNLALLASLQDNLHLPATMIFDLESKLISGPANIAASKSEKSVMRKLAFPLSSDNTRQAMVASFNIAPHIERVAKLFYIGQGRTNSLFGGKRSCVYMRSFEGCFYLTAHRWTDTMFGYNKQIRLCCMDLEGLSKTDGDAEKSFIIGAAQSPMEIYRVEHNPNLRHSVTLEWIRGQPSSNPNETMRFLNTKLNLRGLRAGSSSSASSSAGDYTFEVVAIRKEGGKSLAPVAAIGNDNMDQDGDDIRQLRLLGFGLLESTPGNKRVRPVPLDANNWSPLKHMYEELSISTTSAMSFQQCQAACLSDLDCQLFSVCIRNFEVECVISSMSFKSPSVLQQVAKISKEARDAKEKLVTARLASKVTIDLGATSVELARHPNCELHHNNFLNIFSGPSYGRRTFGNRRVYPVLDQEECAQMCLRHNLQVFRDDVSHIKTAYSTAFSSTSESGLQSPMSAVDIDRIHSLFRNHTRAMGQTCKTFLYVERSRLNETEESTIQENSVIDRNLFNMTQMDGYCVLGDRTTDEEAKQLIDAGKNNPDLDNNYLELELYHFKADVFFEKQYGVSLRKSPMTLKESISYKMFLEGLIDSELADFTLMKSFIDVGNNFQELISADESKCALVCFLQSYGPWPACRSFDIIIETINSTRSHHRCKLNSITLNQAVKTERFDLIENSKEVKMWHYEPRAGFVLDESMLTGDVALRELAAQLEAKAQQAAKFKLHSIGSILLLGMISGILFGIWLGKRYLSSNESSSTQLISPNSALIDDSDLPRTEFVNQVNSEGVIPE